MDGVYSSTADTTLGANANLQNEDRVTRSNCLPRCRNESALVILEQGDFGASALPSELPISVFPAANWREAEQISLDFPCCVLVDFDVDADAIAQQLMARRDEWIRLSCVACSSDTSIRNIVRAMRAGCVDFVAKPIHYTSLIAACSDACRIDSTGEHSPNQFRSRLSTLTERECEVLKMFVQGQNTKVIAKHLGVSYQTIDKHRNRALRKMHVNSLIELSRVLNGELCVCERILSAENTHL